LSRPPTERAGHADPATTGLVLVDEPRDGVARLSLNRPDALNALNRAMADALESALARVAAMADARVLLVAGRGRAFCAGNDIAEMGEVTAAEAEANARRWAAIMERFAALPQVTIAVVDGHALGGGLMLAVAQDLRIASDRARFGLPEVTLGFNPAYGIARLLDVLGGGHGRDLLLTGRSLHATEALRIGLVNRVVAPPTLADTAAAWGAEIAKSPREGLAATKEVVAAIRSGKPGGDPAAYGAALRTGAAARERIRAFVERRRRG
jgi:enoyl-CoA hydratase